MPTQRAILLHAPLALAALLTPHAPAPAQAPALLPATDKSAFTLANPTPRSLLRDLSTDRPDTTESPYTVDAGHVQVELSFIDLARDRRNADAQTRRTVAAAPVLLKLGLLNSVDLQIGLDPYTFERTTDRPTGTTTRAEGFGDTLVRLKVNVWGNDGGDTALAFMPFITLPTAARGLGGDHIEGGLIMPLAVALPGEWSLGLMAEVDLVRAESGDRYVVDFVHTATISHALIGDLAGYLEYAGFATLTRGTEYRASANLGLTYALSSDAQLDAGVRLGLTSAADDLGLFAGLSVRF